MVPFCVSQAFLCMAFDTLASYVVICILISRVPFLCPKHIAICLTTGCIVAIKFIFRCLPVNQLWWHPGNCIFVRSQYPM